MAMGNPPCSIGHTSSHGGCSIAMLVFGGYWPGYSHLIHLHLNHHPSFSPFQPAKELPRSAQQVPLIHRTTQPDQGIKGMKMNLGPFFPLMPQNFSATKIPVFQCLWIVWITIQVSWIELDLVCCCFGFDHLLVMGQQAAPSVCFLPSRF